MLSISDTATEMVNWVFPEHAGAPGEIHGSWMMQWMKSPAESPITGDVRHACALNDADGGERARARSDSGGR
jgi:acyl-CoA hydrolase